MLEEEIVRDLTGQKKTLQVKVKQSTFCCHGGALVATNFSNQHMRDGRHWAQSAGPLLACLRPYLLPPSSRSRGHRQLPNPLS